MPKLGVPHETRMVFHDLRLAIRLRLPLQIFVHELLDVGISYGDFRHIPTDRELDSASSPAQVCASLPTVSTVENLYIYEAFSSALT